MEMINTAIEKKEQVVELGQVSMCTLGVGDCAMENAREAYV